ncbi:MAG: carbohydrate ABC transporter permease [Candidatus Bathyarchaeia archaeon]
MRYGKIGIYIGAALLAFWILFPIYWMLNLSLQSEAEIYTIPPFYLPPNPSINNYWFAFDVESAVKHFLEEKGTSLFLFIPGAVKDFPRSIVNSIIVGSSVMVYNLIAGTLGAFGITRIRFKGDLPLFYASIAGRLIPPVVIAIPYYVIIRSLGLLDNLVSVIMVHIFFTLPFTIWILNTYLLAIPMDIEDAARVDGYSYLEILRKVTLPVIKPAIVAIAITSFMISYGEFFFALLLTKSAASRTIPVIIGSSVAVPRVTKGLICAMGVIAMIPAIIVVIIFRRYLIRGLVAGAIK